MDFLWELSLKSFGFGSTEQIVFDNLKLLQSAYRLKSGKQILARQLLDHHHVHR